MANKQQRALLKQGVEAWNKWRKLSPGIPPNLIGADLRQEDLGGVNLAGASLCSADLSGANLMQASLHRTDLRGADLRGASLSKADLSEADITEANLSEAYLFEANLSRVNLEGADMHWVYLGKADLSGANLVGANLREVDMRGANLIGANLREADLFKANLIGADLQGADLRGTNLGEANLMGARLLKTNFENANLEGCLVYGISSWGLKLEGANQSNLVITPPDYPAIALDNLEVATFMYLLLNHQKIREVFPSIASNIVPILGSFKADGRKDLLEGLRNALRQHDYLPLSVELEKAATPELAEAISTVVGMAKFMIVDFTDASSIPQELLKILQGIPLVPVQPLVQVDSVDSKEIAVLKEFQEYPYAQPIYQYQNLEDAIASVEEKIIAPAEAKANDLLSGR
ncbi:pentapeptide repeat-containing protein [Trichocoleus sp. ST-U3]|uniref:pentapeptide repeat-containing protein n=1 Tax=Coleofasciculus sp. FACHB-542 TaxID=2692787 RepID=UPI001687C998|nr:pentapeptide repeat-containing protein [Coleofasciculus sp. FACHB-542]MBD2085277.1 pentapeptide repeat-containing protein [Coleofasciculus sp. FACHB-542]